MKTVYPTDEVFHLWANGHSADCRISNGRNGNVRAEGNRLYSYSECIAIITPAATLISSYNWSVTTSRHQSLAHRAVRGNIVHLACKFPSDGDVTRLARMAREQAAAILRNIDYGNRAVKINKTMQCEYDSYCALLNWAHTVDSLPAAAVVDTLADLRALRDGVLIQDKRTKVRNSMIYQISNLKDITDRLKKGTLSHHGTVTIADRIKYLANVEDNVRALIERATECGEPIPKGFNKLPAQAKRLIPELEELEAARVAQMAADNAEKIERWRAGETVHTLPRDLPPMIRLINDDADIQTSWGATVPATVAPWLWELVTNARSKALKTVFTVADNIRVGDYRLEEVHATGDITVGCHVIAYSELELMAKALGYI